MNNPLQQIIEKSWATLNKAVNNTDIFIDPEYNVSIYVEQNAKKDFEDCFNDLYKHLLNDYMKNTVDALDRHKVASIIIISLIKSNAIKFRGDPPKGKTFFGHYLIAVSIGISYMQNRLNDKLIKKGKNPIGKLWMPDALSCDRPYFEILCRNLHYTKNDTRWTLNPLEMAEKLFLLEYMTLEKNGVDPHILKADVQK